MSTASLRERLESSLREMLAVHDDNVAQGRVRYAKGSYVHRAEKKARAVLAECDMEKSNNG
jgi:hypothetical protein